MILNIFAGVKDAKTSERGAFCNPGTYKVRIKRALTKHTRKNYDAFILEFVVESSNYAQSKADAIKAFGDKPYDMDALEKRLPNKPGTTASWFQSLQDKDIGFGALKGFAASILGENSDNKDFAEEVEGFLSAAVADGTLNGLLVPLEVVPIITKKGGDFSLYRWGQIIPEALTAVAS